MIYDDILSNTTSTGDGNFHAVIMIRPGSEEDVKAARNLSARMAMKAISLGGTCTG